MGVRHRRDGMLLTRAMVLLLLFTALGREACGQLYEGQLRVSSLGLLNDTFGYDGKEVVYFGEAVGDVIGRGGYAWVNVYDGDYAVGVYAPAELLGGLTVLGDYGHKGDMVEVTGVFNRACREHGGDLDIHAKSVRIVAKGYAVEHPVNASKVVFTILLLVSSVPLLMVYSRVKNGVKK